jgi:hypothetical protein
MMQRQRGFKMKAEMTAQLVIKYLAANGGTATPEGTLKKFGLVKKVIKDFGNGLVKMGYYVEGKEEAILMLTEAKEETKKEEEKEPKSRAADMAKSRKSAAGYIRDARLTERAAKSLESLCLEWGMTKTQVINKLLEEQEQLQMF